MNNRTFLAVTAVILSIIAVSIAAGWDGFLNNDLQEGNSDVYRLQGADKFCKQHGHELGYYESGLLAPTDVTTEVEASIHCFNTNDSTQNTSFYNERTYFINSSYAVKATVTE